MCLIKEKNEKKDTYLLPNLNHGLPEVLGFHAVAVVTHLVLDDVLNHKHLL